MGAACRQGDLAMKYGMVDGAPVGFLNAFENANSYCESDTSWVGAGSTTMAGGATITVHFNIPELPCTYLPAPPDQD